MLVSLDGETLRLTATTEMSGDDILMALHTHYAAHSFRHAVWDMRASGLSAFDPASIRRAGVEGAQYAEKRGPGARTAVLVNDEQEELLIRAVSIWAEDAGPILLRAFTDEATMRAWLKDENSPG